MWRIRFADNIAWFKRTTAVLALIVIVATGVCMMQTSVGDNLTTDKVVTGEITVTYDDEDIISYISDKMSQDESFNPSLLDINSDEFKNLIDVYGYVDGQQVKLTDYYLYVGGPLQKGQNELTVYVLTKGGDFNDDLLSIESSTKVSIDLSKLDFEPVLLEGITVEGPSEGKVFEGSTTEEEARNLIKVFAHYSNNYSVA